MNRRLTDRIVRMKVESEGQLLLAADVRQVGRKLWGASAGIRSIFEEKPPVRRMFERIGLLVSRLRECSLAHCSHDLPAEYAHDTAGLPGLKISDTEKNDEI